MSTNKFDLIWYAQYKSIIDIDIGSDIVGGCCVVLMCPLKG